VIEVAFGRQLERDDIPLLCDGIRSRLSTQAADVVVCDVSALARIDAVIVDALARLALTAQRLGLQMQVRHASPHLRGLVALMGLEGVVPLDALDAREPQPLSLDGELVGQVEQREDPGGVQEVDDPGDPVA
jgi:anti-anti-sigma regulatory factor